MNEHLRKSIGTKLTAVCFIALTLLGNLWIILAITGQRIPVIVTNGFMLAVVGVFFGGGLMAFVAIFPDGLRKRR